MKLADELEALDKKAAEGPWFCGPGEGKDGLTRVDDGRTADDCLFPFELEAHDAALVCLLRNNLPAIIAALRADTRAEALDKEVLDRFRFMLGFIERDGVTDDTYLAVSVHGITAASEHLKMAPTVGDLRKVVAAGTISPQFTKEKP